MGQPPASSGRKPVCVGARVTLRAIEFHEVRRRASPAAACHIRIILPRDKRLSERKEMLVKTISKFEKERKYPGHIVVDVDPV